MIKISKKGNIVGYKTVGRVHYDVVYSPKQNYSYFFKGDQVICRGLGIWTPLQINIFKFSKKDIEIFSSLLREVENEYRRLEDERKKQALWWLDS